MASLGILPILPSVARPQQEEPFVPPPPESIETTPGEEQAFVPPPPESLGQAAEEPFLPPPPESLEPEGFQDPLTTAQNLVRRGAITGAASAISGTAQVLAGPEVEQGLARFTGAGMAEAAAEKIGLMSPWGNTPIGAAARSWLKTFRENKRSAQKFVREQAGEIARLRPVIEEALPVDDDIAGSLVGDILEGVGNLGITATAWMTPGVGILAGPTVSIGQTYQEAHDDAEAALRVRREIGEIQATDEQIQALAHDAGMKNLPAASLDVLGDRLVVGRLLKPFIGKITVGKLLSEIGAKAAVEGATEGAQQVWLNSVAKVLSGYDPNRTLDEGVIRAVTVGTAVGFLGSGAIDTAQAYESARVQRANAEMEQARATVAGQQLAATAPSAAPIIEQAERGELDTLEKLDQAQRRIVEQANETVSQKQVAAVARRQANAALVEATEVESEIESVLAQTEPDPSETLERVQALGQMTEDDVVVEGVARGLDPHEQVERKYPQFAQAMKADPGVEGQLPIEVRQPDGTIEPMLFSGYWPADVSEMMAPGQGRRPAVASLTPAGFSHGALPANVQILTPVPTPEEWDAGLIAEMEAQNAEEIGTRTETVGPQGGAEAGLAEVRSLRLRGDAQGGLETVAGAPAEPVAAPAPVLPPLPPTAQITVQQPQGEVPGYVQIDLIDEAGNNIASLSPQDLAAQGFAMPAIPIDIQSGRYRMTDLDRIAAGYQQLNRAVVPIVVEPNGVIRSAQAAAAPSLPQEQAERTTAAMAQGAREVTGRKARRLAKIGLPANGEPDLLNVLQEMGGVPAPRPGTPDPEYTAFRDAFSGIAQFLVNTAGKGSKYGAGRLDTFVGPEGLLAQEGIGGIDTIDQLYDAVQRAMGQRVALRRAALQATKLQDLEAALLGNEKLIRFKSEKTFSVDDLQVGDSFRVAGERFIVTDIDEDGNVVIEDGLTYEIAPGTEIYPDKGRIQRVRREVEFVPEPEQAEPAPEAPAVMPEAAFVPPPPIPDVAAPVPVVAPPLELASATEDELAAEAAAARRANEIRQARERMLEQAEAPLTRPGQIPLEQADLFVEGENLFGPPSAERQSQIEEAPAAYGPPETAITINEAGDNFFVQAMQGDRQIGFARLQRRPDGVFPLYVEVQEPFRRQGVASRMYEEFERQHPDLPVLTSENLTEEGAAFSNARQQRAQARGVRPQVLVGESVVQQVQRTTGQPAPVSADPATYEPLHPPANLVVAEGGPGELEAAETEGLAILQNQPDPLPEPVKTLVFGEEFTVAGKRGLTPEEREAARVRAKRVFDAADLPVVWDEDNEVYRLADPMTANEAAGRRLLELARAEFAHGVQRGDPLLSVLTNSIRNPDGGLWVSRAFSPTLRNQLFSISQGEASFYGLMLGALAATKRTLSFVARHVDVVLHKAYSDAFGGEAIGTILDRTRKETGDDIETRLQQTEIGKEIEAAQDQSTSPATDLDLFIAELMRQSGRGLRISLLPEDSKKRIESLFPLANWREIITKRGAEGLQNDFFRLLTTGSATPPGQGEGNVARLDRTVQREMRGILADAMRRMGFLPDRQIQDQADLLEELAVSMGDAQTRVERLERTDRAVRQEIQAREADELAAAEQDENIDPEAIEAKYEEMRAAWDEAVGQMSGTASSAGTLRRLLKRFLVPVLGKGSFRQAIANGASVDQLKAQLAEAVDSTLEYMNAAASEAALDAETVSQISSEINAAFDRMARVASLRPLVDVIIDAPPSRQTDQAWINRTARAYLEDFGVDPDLSERAAEVFTRRFGELYTDSRKKAFDKIRQQMTRREQAALGLPRAGKKLWTRIEEAVNAGIFDNGAVLSNLAREYGWTVPSEQQISALKAMADREQLLRSLDEQERARIGDDPQALEAARMEKEAATKDERMRLRREMQTTWARFSRPMTFRTPEGRRNLAAAGGEFLSANMLLKLGFGVKQHVDVLSQLAWHSPTRAIAAALERFGAARQAGESTDFWRDVSLTLADAAQNFRDSAAQAIVEYRQGLAQRGEVRNVEGLISTVSFFDRVRQRAQDYDSRGQHGRANVLRILGWAQASFRLARALDNLQGTFVENQETRERLVSELETNGLTFEQARAKATEILGDRQAEVHLALARAKQLIDDNGLEVNATQLQSAAYEVFKARQMTRMRAAGIDVDRMAHSREILRQTIGWNMPERTGLGAVVAAPVRGIGRALEQLGVPLPFGRFGNAIAIGVNRALTWTPVGYFPSVFGGEQNAWFATPKDRIQRKIEATLGTSMAGAFLGLMAAGVLRVWNKPPEDPEDREIWEKDGHRAGTVEFWIGDQFVPVSTSSGPLAFARPVLGAIGQLQDAIDAGNKRNRARQRRAEREGATFVPEPAITGKDAVAALLWGAYQAALGGRTAGGLVGSITRDTGVPDFKMFAASQASPFVLGLPAYQEIQRAMGTRLDPRIADFTDLLLPTGGSPAVRRNFLGDELTRDRVQTIVQTLTGGTSGPVDPKTSQAMAPYRIFGRIDYRPDGISRTEGFFIDGAFRPLSDEEWLRANRLRGAYLRIAMMQIDESLPDPLLEQEVAYAAREAKRLALEQAAGAQAIDTLQLESMEAGVRDLEKAAPRLYAIVQNLPPDQWQPIIDREIAAGRVPMLEGKPHPAFVTAWNRLVSAGP